MSLDSNSFETVDDILGTDVIFQDHYSLKLSSKKLKSGKCQVKFHARIRGEKNMHGYVLTDSNYTLRNVVVHIKDRLSTIQRNKDFQHIHLYSIRKRTQDDLGFIIFEDN